MGELFGLVKLAGCVAEGLLDGERIVRSDVKGEVEGLAIESWVARYAHPFSVVEDDGGVMVRDSGVEPGETAAGKLHFIALTGLSTARELQGGT